MRGRPQEGDPILLVPSPELGGALVHTWLDDRRGYAPDRSNAQYIADTLRDKKLDGAKVGVEKGSHGLPAGTYEGLVAALPKARFIDGSGIVEAVKTVKSPREIAHIRAAAKTTAAGMAAAIDAAREGATDNDVAAAASEALIAAGSEYMCLSPVVTSGRRSGILHSTHKRNRLEKGDVVLLEMGGCIHRYSAPTMRTVFIGEPPAEARRMAEACLTALGNILNTIRAGATADEVAQVGWESILSAGEGFVFPRQLRLCDRRGIPADVGRRYGGNHVRHRHRSPSRNGLPSPRRATADGTIRHGVQRDDGRHRGRLRGTDKLPPRDRRSVGAIRESPLREVIFRVILVSIGTASGCRRRARGRHSWGRWRTGASRPRSGWTLSEEAVTSKYLESSG